MAASKQQLTNGDEDPYKSEGCIEWKLDNLTGFSQEEEGSERFSDPISVLGIPWTISAEIKKSDQSEQKYLHFNLEYNAHTAVPSPHYEATVKLKILAQQKGSHDHIKQLDMDGYNLFLGQDDADSIPLENMTFEDLMDPDKGLYDRQTDSIILAVDLVTMNMTEVGGGECVVVAQNELKLDKIPTSISMQIGHLEWEINSEFNYQITKAAKSLKLSCKDVAEGRIDKVLLELCGHHRKDPKSEAYSALPERIWERHWFTRERNSLLNVLLKCDNNLLFTVRVLKERSLFPDFTKETATVGRSAANVILLVGTQRFHVNKQLLSHFSAYFDRTFNGAFPVAVQQEVELDAGRHSPELFHDFLLVMCVAEALPNSMNVTALFKLADYYDAENVREKCEQHIRLAREMPIEKRVLLARDYGSTETQALIAGSATPEQSKRLILMFMQNRSL